MKKFDSITFLSQKGQHQLNGEGHPKLIGLFSKRLIDSSISLIFAVVFFPLFLLIALAIKLDSSGPVIFIQERWGQRMRPFKMFKFRTLRHNLPDPHQRYEMIETDPRITRVGTFLRKTSLDELPQLWNILLGNMSLVGPRPLIEWESRECMIRHADRFSVKPGITGFSQIYARNSVSLAERSDWDILYVRHWSVFLDLKILILSPFRIFFMKGIYPKKMER